MRTRPELHEAENKVEARCEAETEAKNFVLEAMLSLRT